jgi:hypothetical protein
MGRSVRRITASTIERRWGSPVGRRRPRRRSNAWPCLTDGNEEWFDLHRFKTVQSFPSLPQARENFASMLVATFVTACPPFAVFHRRTVS